MIRKTYAELLANAESRIAAGFGTKIAKQGALATVSNAYDLVRESFRIIGRLSLYWAYRDSGVLYAECLRLELQSRDTRIQQQREYITMQEARLASWVQRERAVYTTQGFQKWESV